MTMRILVPVDGSASSRAAVRFLAGRETMLGQNPEIELLTVQNVVPQRLVEMLSLESLESYYRAEGERVFESLRGEIRAAGFQAKEVVRGGEPGKVIAKEAEDLDADLIVMGSRGQSLWKSLFLGSVSNAVLAESKRPLLLLRDEVPKTGDRLRVGIAVDGSAYGEAATDYVLAHKDFFGADPDFRVLHVVRDYETLVATTSVEYVMSHRQVREERTRPPRDRLARLRQLQVGRSRLDRHAHRGRMQGAAPRRPPLIPSA